MPGKGFLADIMTAAEARNWPRYRELAAACVVTKFANKVLGARIVDPDDWTQAHTFVSRLEPFSPERNRLIDLLVAVDQFRDLEASKLLLALAHELHADGQNASAADVFLIAERHANCLELKLEALRWRAFMYRLLERFDDAKQLYADLAMRSTCACRAEMQLHAELGLACVEMERGNIPLAMRLTNAVIEHAREAGNALIEGKALVARSRLHGTRLDVCAAEADCLAALDLLEDQAERERCLINLGWTQRVQGKLVCAIDSALTVARSYDAERRGWAQVLLYQIAIDRGDRVARDEWRRALAAGPLTRTLECTYLRTVSLERASDCDFEGAIDAAALMLAAAERYKIPELIFQAEQGIAELRAGRIPALYNYRPAGARPPVAAGRLVEPTSARRDAFAPAPFGD